MRRQPTMADIARQAGVSRIAVSYALNDRPGVSSGLRARILAIARELGYRANVPALALHGAAAQAVGLVIMRSSAALTVEVFARHLIAGVQTELSAHGFGLALQFVTDQAEEIAVHRRWHAEQRVDGVLLVNPRTEDPRVAALTTLGLPAVVIGGVPQANGVWSDADPWIAETVTHLTALGHRRIARVSGPPGLVHTDVRDAAFRAHAADHGAELTIVRGDYTGASGARLTRDLLASATPPTALIYDNDVMAIAGLGAARAAGLAVPTDVSLVACEDSAICQLVRPSITAVQRDITGLGARSARLLLEAVGTGGPGAGVQAPTAHLIVRRSTGPA